MRILRLEKPVRHRVGNHEGGDVPGGRISCGDEQRQSNEGGEMTN